MPDTPNDQGQHSSRELLQALTAEGLSLAEIARRLGRSTRLLRFVLRGQKPGNNLVPALTELAETGRVTREPERRTTRAGERARIRSRGGQTITPPAPRGRPAKKAPAKKAPAKKAPARGARTRSGAQPGFVRTPPPSGQNRLDVRRTQFPGRRTKTDIRVPRRGWNREMGNEAIIGAVNEGVTNRQRLQITTWVEIGAAAERERMPVVLGGKGGYDSENFARAIAIEQDDALSLLEAQISERYPAFETGDWTIIQVELDFW